MFNVAARIFKITYVAHITFGLDSTGLDNSSENVLGFLTESTIQNLLLGSVALMVAVLSTFQTRNLPSPQVQFSPDS